MPRQPAALQGLPVVPGERPLAPDWLSLEVQEIWERVTATLPVARITDAGFQLLGPFLAQHIRFAEALGKAAEIALDEPGVFEDDAKRARLRSLLKAHAEQSERIGNLATKLRLTPQARYTPDSTTRLRSVSDPTAPWNDWSNNAKRDPPKAS